MIVNGYDPSCPHRLTHGDEQDRSGVAIVVYDADGLNPLAIDSVRCGVEPTAKLS
jgi:hypothetical protein